MTEFRINVVVDPSGATGGARRVRRELDGVQKSAKGLQRTLGRVFAFIGAGALLRSGIGLLAQYEQTMSTVKAITGATEIQFQALRDEAERLGATTRFSASQAGEGLIFLARAGFDADEAIQVLGPTLQLAQAGALGLGRAADIATNVLKAFRLEAGDTQRVVDVLALAANSANTDVSQLGQALSFVAPSAAGLGIELEETAAAIGVLSDAGLQASRAGTGLLNIIATLESPTKKARDVFAQFGVTVDQIKPSSVGLSDALTVLRDAGLSAGDGLQVFGKRGGPAFEVLLNSIPRVRELTEELNDAGGTAKRISAIMDDNLNGALLATKSALEAVVLAIGGAGATGAFTGFFSVVAEGLRGLATNIETFIDVMETLGTFITIQFARTAIPAAIGALKALGIAIITNPIGLIATALIAATAAFVGFSDRISLGAGQVGTAFDFIIVVVGRLSSIFVGILKNVISFFSGVQTEVDEFDFSDFVRGAAQAVDNVIAFFKAGYAGILNDTVNFVAAIDGAFTGIANFFPGVEVQRVIENTGRTSGEVFSIVYGNAVKNGPISRFVNEALVDAGKRGAERAAREAADAFNEGVKTGIDPNFDAGTRGDGTGKLPIGQVDRNSILQQTLKSLDEEATLLRVVGDERRVLQGILETESSIRKTLRENNEDLTEEQINSLAKLTDSERQNIEELTRRNLTLERQGQILEGIIGPQADFIAQQDALNKLLAEGAINQQQFNAAIEQTGLAQSLRSLDQELFGAFGLGLESRISQIETFEQQRLDIVQQALDARIISEQDAAERIRAINRQTAAEIQQATSQGFLMMSRAAQDSFGSILEATAAFGGESSQLYRSLFAVQQSFAVASAIVNTSNAVTQALASAPPPVNFIQAALVAAQGAAEIATITAQTFGGFKDGGFVEAQHGGSIRGAGSSRSDSIPAMLSDGEFVVNARAARQNAGTLESINRGGGGTTTKVFNTTIQVNGVRNVDEFRKSQAQIVRDMNKTLQRGQRDL